MLNQKRLSTILAALLLSAGILIPLSHGWAFAHTPPAPPTDSSIAKTAEPNADAPKSQEPPSKTQKASFSFCPKSATLYKKQLLWYATGGWKSYTTSFVNHIQFFKGAQWVGIKVGKVICLYQGGEGTSFPVPLEKDDLLISPSTGKWSKDLGGYKTCVSSKTADCPFDKPKSTDTTDMKKIYQDIRTFK